MKPDFWTRYLDGPLAVTDDRLGDYLLRVAAGSLDAKTLYRNLGRLLPLFEDRAPLLKMISTAAGGEHLPPYVFYMAGQRWPELRGPIHDGMNKAAKASFYLEGETVVVLDSSVGMMRPIHENTRLTKIEAAASFAAQLRGERVRYFTASNQLLEVNTSLLSKDGPGLGGADYLMIHQEPGKDFLLRALALLTRDVRYRRMIILTDDGAKVAPHIPEFGVQGRAYHIFDSFGAFELNSLRLTENSHKFYMEALENKPTTGTLH